MFRSKKGASQSPENAGETTVAVDAPPPQAESVKAEPRRNIPFPAARPMPHTAFPLDISRRSSELAQIGGRSGEASQHAAASKDKTLTVGRDVELRGEITVCDRLVIDGTARLSVTGARVLQVGPAGLFSGSADVAEADIGGRFNGELTVRERLTIRASGQVRGRIRYGQIVIEAGGEVSGDVATFDSEVHGEADEEPSRDEGLSTAEPLSEMKLAAPAD